MTEFKHYTIADEDMPEKCPESCIYKRFSKNMENSAKHDAVIATAAREQERKDTIFELLKHFKFACPSDPVNPICGMCGANKYCVELRNQEKPR